ncbi:MAG: hypothetical protein P8L47_03565, partial [Candidatus Marinamargulisbacteria bacterium]|nr:hypothetical protein [Candidatus Marinamargulisbacteria bacterium]
MRREKEMQNIQPPMQPGYPMSPATKKQAQSETNLQEFKTKLNDLISPHSPHSPHNFNKNKRVTNTIFLVDQLYDTYATHCDTN